MIIKAIIHLNSTCLNNRNNEGKVVAQEFFVDNIGQLKTQISFVFNQPDWSRVNASIHYKVSPFERNSAIASVDMNNNETIIPDVPINAAGDRVIIVYISNAQMKAGITTEQEKRYWKLYEEIFQTNRPSYVTKEQPADVPSFLNLSSNVIEDEEEYYDDEENEEDNDPFSYV